MSIPLVDLKAQYATIKNELDTAIHHILDNTAFIMGKPVSDFEAKFGAYTQAKHAIGVSSGTDALLIAMQAIGLQADDEVITTAHTFIATVEPMMQLGLKPVFVDIDPVTYNIDVSKIAAAITEKTKAIVPVHLYGQAANMTAIAEIAAKHKLHILEDAAQAHGSRWNNQAVGTHSLATTFSFYPGKNLGAAGDAGGIITNDDAVAEAARLLLNHGSETKYRHVKIGYTSRLDALQAAVLTVKLKYIEKWTEQRRKNAAYYDELMAEIPNVVAPKSDKQARHVYHLYVVRVPRDREAVLQYLHDKGIGAGIHYPIPLHLQPALAGLGYKEGDFPHTEAAAQQIISLPMFPELTKSQMEEVAQTLHEAISVTA
ncbi:MAG: DegT/DnrJ/EryC1/StrS family aminotransferase [Anaerolineae bacterium]|nr:DegT/DnrJ/EryC1/StrS family aminotransferase [Anaerolineae bacterium]